VSLFAPARAFSQGIRSGSTLVRPIEWHVDRSARSGVTDSPAPLAGDDHEPVLDRVGSTRQWGRRDLCEVSETRKGNWPFCRAGQEDPIRPSGTWSMADSLRATRPDACGRSIGTATRRAGLLAYGRNSCRAAFPPLWQWPACPRNVTDYSGGPATDFHRLPYSPQARSIPAWSTFRGVVLDSFPKATVKGGNLQESARESGMN